MHLCYIDESGTPDIPGNTSHYCLAGLSVPVWHWRDADREVAEILRRYGLEDAELHTAWLVRRYIEQRKIRDFDDLDWSERRARVGQYRNNELYRLQALPNPKPYKQAKKTYRHTEPYIHLTEKQRQSVVREVAETVAGWGFARLFAENIDKRQLNPYGQSTADAQAFEQIVSRFQRYLQVTDPNQFGLLVHDNNQSVAKKHTEMMRSFHHSGTSFTDPITNIIETPLFVDSKLTRMVQIADLCAYALRRFHERGEADLFRLVFQRGDRQGTRVVGVRHFTGRLSCNCEICAAHNA